MLRNGQVKKILRLLIVEDEKQMCDTIARSLYAAGYEVDTCVTMARRLWNACLLYTSDAADEL